MPDKADARTARRSSWGLRGPMLLHHAEAERPFADSLRDFPYEDDAGASTLIAQGWTISLNAAFCVLNELCRPPHLGMVGEARLRELIAEWAEGADHPLASPLLGAAHLLVSGGAMPWPNGVRLMHRVGAYEGQRAALLIAYAASDCESREGDEALEAAHVEIVQRWEAMGV